MMRWIKTALRIIVSPFWRLTAPIRRPLVQKFDARITTIVEQSITSALVGPSAALGRIEETVNVGRHVVEHQNADANLLLDGMIREVARLQMQIEALREVVEESQSRDTLNLVGGEGEADRKAG